MNACAVFSYRISRALHLRANNFAGGLLDSIEKRLAMLLVRLANMDRPEWAHAELGDHSTRDLDRTFDIISSTRGHRGKKNLFRRSAAQQHRNLVFEVFALFHPAVSFRQRLSHTERAASRQNGDLVYRVCILDRKTYSDVSRFVNCGCVTLLFVH